MCAHLHADAAVVFAKVTMPHCCDKKHFSAVLGTVRQEVVKVLTSLQTKVHPLKFWAMAPDYST
jgi:hypothetical protein